MNSVISIDSVTLVTGQQVDVGATYVCDTSNVVRISVIVVGPGPLTDVGPVNIAGAAMGPTCDGVSHQTILHAFGPNGAFAKGETVLVVVTLQESNGVPVDGKQRTVVL